MDARCGGFGEGDFGVGGFDICVREDVSEVRDFFEVERGVGLIDKDLVSGHVDWRLSAFRTRVANSSVTSSLTFNSFDGACFTF